MRTTKATRQFDRDVRRIKAGLHRYKEIYALVRARIVLARDQPLPARFGDHALAGNWKGYRECHPLPDLLLIYCKVSKDVLELVRLGSHSELF